jgi:Na+-driven multidrug efflux pump
MSSPNFGRLQPASPSPAATLTTQLTNAFTLPVPAIPDAASSIPVLRIIEQQTMGAASCEKHPAANEDAGHPDDEASGRTGGSHHSPLSPIHGGRKATTTPSTAASRRSGDEEEPHAREVVCFTRNFETERAFFDLCGPAMCMQFFRFGVIALATSFAGRRLSPTEFGGYLLGFSYANIFGIATGIGVASVLDTLCTQEHGKAAHSPMQGFHVRCAAVVCVGFSTLYALSCVTIGRALITASVDAQIAEAAMRYIVPSVLFVGGTTLASCAQKFLAAQRRVRYAMYAHAAASAATLVLCVFAIDVLGVGGGGLSVCMGIGRIIAVCGMAYLGSRDADVTRSWGEWSWRRSVLQAKPLLAFVRSSGHSMIMSCADRWTLEAMTLLCSAYGTTTLVGTADASSAATGVTAAPLVRHQDATALTTLAPSAAVVQNVDLNAFGTSSTLWSVAFFTGAGVYVGASTLVGNALGAGNGPEARSNAFTALRLVVSMSATLGILYVAFPYQALSLFLGSQNQATADLTAALSPLLALVVVADTTVYVMQGVLRAAGRVVFASRLAMVTQFGVGLPLAYVLVAVLRVPAAKGTLIALNVSLWLQVVVQVWNLVARTQWGTLAYQIATAAPGPRDVTGESSTAAPTIVIDSIGAVAPASA